MVWPDWPEELSRGVEEKLKDFHRMHPGLEAVEENSAKWNAAFQGWRNDPSSAAAIARCFSAPTCFGQRLKSATTARSPRGLVQAVCQIEGLKPLTLLATWGDVWAQPPEGLPESDRSRFESSMALVAEWAGQRIHSVLRALREHVQELYGERFRGLYVFGSYARPDAGIELPEDSDLDVALILSDFENVYDERARFGEITYDLSLEHGLAISVVPIREADFREGRTNFTRVISEYAIRV